MGCREVSQEAAPESREFQGGGPTLNIKGGALEV